MSFAKMVELGHIVGAGHCPACEWNHLGVDGATLPCLSECKGGRVHSHFMGAENLGGRTGLVFDRSCDVCGDLAQYDLPDGAEVDRARVEANRERAEAHRELIMPRAAVDAGLVPVRATGQARVEQGKFGDGFFGAAAADLIAKFTVRYIFYDGAVTEVALHADAPPVYITPTVREQLLKLWGIK